MIREAELNKDKQRGIRAEQLLNDPLTKEAFDAIRNNLYRIISTSSFDQKDQREDCYRMLRASEAFEGQFKRYIEKGKLAEAKLNPVQKLVKRVQEL